MSSSPKPPLPRVTCGFGFQADAGTTQPWNFSFFRTLPVRTLEPAKAFTMGTQRTKPEFVWIFNSNRRIYEKDGRRSNSPIYSEHWEKFKVTGETSRSWLTDYWHKVPKQGGLGYAFSQEQVDDDVWAHDNRYRIVESVRSCKDVACLREVARILGCAVVQPS